MTQFITVYITCKDDVEADRIGKDLVEKKLVGCVNIIPNIRSIYRWQEKIHHESETLLIAKTKLSLFEELKKEVKSKHSYDIPCINALPILEGNKDYLKWLEEETK